jgi:hydrogenase maturation protease
MIMDHPSVLIVGIGNRLLGDEGVGIHVVEWLRRSGLPADASLVLCHTDLLSLAPLYSREPRIIIVDAIQTGDVPGTIHCLREQDFKSYETRSASAHQVSALETALLLKATAPGFEKAEFIFIGVEPEKIAIGAGLSRAVEEAIPFLLERIRGLLNT